MGPAHPGNRAGERALHMELTPPSTLPAAPPAPPSLRHLLLLLFSFSFPQNIRHGYLIEKEAGGGGREKREGEREIRDGNFNDISGGKPLVRGPARGVEREWDRTVGEMNKKIV